jgi:hypothetical protein
MAHERTVIEPAAGLTVLVGPNNCGKSAIVHALQTLCYNKPADFAVRHGAKGSSVTVETDDGHVVAWRRKKGVVSYMIDGREVGRLGQGGVPDDLHKILRMPRIEPSNDNGSPFYVHFGLQKSPIFLLDDPPARAATFFASSSDAEKLLAMQRLHRDRTRDNRRDLERLAAEAGLLDQRLTAAEPVTAVAEKVSALEETYRRLTDAQRNIASRQDFMVRLDRATNRRVTQAARVQAANHWSSRRASPTRRRSKKCSAVCAGLARKSGRPASVPGRCISCSNLPRGGTEARCRRRFRNCSHRASRCEGQRVSSTTSPR